MAKSCVFLFFFISEFQERSFGVFFAVTKLFGSTHRLVVDNEGNFWKKKKKKGSNPQIVLLLFGKILLRISLPENLFSIYHTVVLS